VAEASDQVAVIGGGLAGATAALRLAQRGYKVTLFEQDAYLGGQFRAIPANVDGREFYHEHCYHLFDNWYHNFWNLIAELGLKDRFVGRHSVKYLRAGEFPKMTELRNVGSWSSYLENLFSGVLSVPDMYLFLYSYIDLLASPLLRDSYRNIVSVNEFMRSRLYSTERSVGMHDNVLLKAFGVPSFDTAARSYRKYVKFSAVEPTPMFSIMRGNVRDNFWSQLEKTLVQEFQVEIRCLNRLDQIILGQDGNIDSLLLSELSHSPTLFDDELVKTKRKYKFKINGSIVLAVPPASLVNLVTADLYRREPRWGRVVKLRTEPMASVHLHFNAKFLARLNRSGIKSLPKVPVILLDSQYSITFLDNSHTWTNVKEPYVHVIASNYRELSCLDVKNPDQFTHQGKLHKKRTTSGSYYGVNIQDPKSPLDYILAELARYMPFSLDELDLESVQIDDNTRYPIFINGIGSWPNRPKLRTPIGNLFMAGAHCQTAIDVTTVEAAVLSGLEAAEAIRHRHGRGDPVKIIYPKSHPFFFFTPWQLMGAPYAMAAKVLSELHQLAKRQGIFDRDR
jgi:hypothetical protein